MLKKISLVSIIVIDSRGKEIIRLPGSDPTWKPQ